jgi:phosphoglycolate phosphatase
MTSNGKAGRPQPRIRGVLFDKDGTLLDYGRTWTPINREVAFMAARGDEALAHRLMVRAGQCPLTHAVDAGSPFAAGTHHDVAAAFEELLGAATPGGLADTIAQIFETAGAQHSALADGVYETLAALSAAGVTMGIASNDTRAGIDASLGRHAGVMDAMVFVAGCDSGHGAKPGPGMALAFAAAVGLPIGEIAVVGDAVHDLEMARRAGAGLRIGIEGGTTPRDVLAAEADLVLARLIELVDAIKSGSE